MSSIFFKPPEKRARLAGSENASFCGHLSEMKQRKLSKSDSELITFFQTVQCRDVLHDAMTNHDFPHDDGHPRSITSFAFFAEMSGNETAFVEAFRIMIDSNPEVAVDWLTEHFIVDCEEMISILSSHGLLPTSENSNNKTAINIVFSQAHLGNAPFFLALNKAGVTLGSLKLHQNGYDFSLADIAQSKRRTTLAFTMDCLAVSPLHQYTNSYPHLAPVDATPESFSGQQSDPHLCCRIRYHLSPGQSLKTLNDEIEVYTPSLQRELCERFLILMLKRDTFDENVNLAVQLRSLKDYLTLPVVKEHLAGLCTWSDDAQAPTFHADTLTGLIAQLHLFILTGSKDMDNKTEKVITDDLRLSLNRWLDAKHQALIDKLSVEKSNTFMLSVEISDILHTLRNNDIFNQLIDDAGDYISACFNALSKPRSLSSDITEELRPISTKLAQRR